MKIKNTATRFLAAVLCALMVLSTFAVIPAIAEETSATTGETTATNENVTPLSENQDFSHLTGFDYLMAVSAAGGKVTFDDWVIPDALQTKINTINNNSSYTASKKASEIRKAYAPYTQNYLLSKTGIYFTNAAGTDLTSAKIVDARADGATTPDYRINLSSSGHYVNNRIFNAGDMHFDQMATKKINGSSAFLELLNGEVGPTKFSITMDFTLSDAFTGTAEGNDKNLHAYTGHRGFSVIDFGGSWALKATAPGVGQITVEKDENGEPVKYNENHTQSDDGRYYKIMSVSAGSADVGYFYSCDYNDQGGYVAYVFDADTKMGWSNDSTLLGNLRDDVADDPETEEDEAVIYNEKYLITDENDPHYTYVEVEGEGETKTKVPTSYYVKSIAAGSVPYYLIDGDETNGETFSYKVGEPVTIRFDFEKTWKSGDNNDVVVVKIYGVKDNGNGTTTDFYIGQKDYKTTDTVKDYGFRMCDNASSGLLFDNLSIVIAEDSQTLPCNGDHSSYWSKCEPKVENLPNALTLKYACGLTEYVDYIVENNITNVVSGKSLTLTGDTLTNTTKSGKAYKFSTYTTTLITSASYENPSAEHTLIRIGGRNVLRITKDGQLVTYNHDTSDTTPEPLGVTLEASKKYALKMVFRPVSEVTYNIDFYIDNEFKHTETVAVVETSSLFRVTNLTKTVDSKAVNTVYADGSRLTTDSDFIVAAEINTSKTYAKPKADSPIISLGGKALLTLNKEGKLVLEGGDVVLESLKGISTYAVAIKMVPMYNSFSYVVYIENKEVGRSQVSFDACESFTFSAPTGIDLNNIKVAHFNTTYPTEDIGIKSVTNANATPCTHRNFNTLTGSDKTVTRRFYTAPLYTKHPTLTTEIMGVNELWYSYDCYYCGERIYESMGENLYNSQKDNFKAMSGSNSGENSNTYFNKDGTYTFENTAVKYIYTNRNITASGRGNSYWLNFKIKFDTLNIDGNLGVKSRGSSGGSVLALMDGFAAPLRMYLIKPNDTDGTPITDTTNPNKVTLCTAEDGYSANAVAGTDYSDKYVVIRNNTNTSEHLTLVKQGDVINFTIYNKPGSSLRIWVNGVLMATGGTASGTSKTDSTTGYSFRVFERDHLFGGELSNFAFVLDDRKDPETHVHVENPTSGKRVTFTDDTLNYIYQCYCDAYVVETIDKVILNDISNFYNGYGKVENLDIPENNRFWVSTDINIKKDGLSGSLIKIGDNSALDLSQLKNITAPTSVNASIMIVNSTMGKVYIDGTYIQNIIFNGDINSVTFGEEDTYDNYVTFKHNKIVTLAQNVETPPTVTFDDNPEGAICYHQNNTNTSYRKDYIFAAPTGGYTFGENATVKGMKNIKARYICSKCGEAVYAVQGEAVEVNFTPNSGYDGGGSAKQTMDANGNATLPNKATAILTNLSDMGRSNSFWISYTIKPETIAYNNLIASKKSSGGSFLAFQGDSGNETTASGAYTHHHLLRAYAVLRPDAEDENGVYGIEDYYDDRIGIYHTNAASMANKPESAYEFVLMEGCSYKIDLCFERADAESSHYSIYVNGKRVYTSGKLGNNWLDPERMNNAAALEGLKQRPAALRFLDGTYGTYEISNFAFVKMGSGYDDYSNNTSVFEMSATKPAEAGVLASINGVELLSATADGQLTVGGTALYTKADDVFTPAVLTDTASNLAIVYYDETARYYINEDLMFLGETDNVTASIAVGDTDISSTNLKVGSTVTVSDIYGVVGDGDADYITFQEGVDTTFNSEIRILSGVDMLYYNRVGYRVVTDNNKVVTSIEKKSLDVYSSVIENVGSTANTVDASRYGHRYFSILKLTDLANQDAANEYYLYVTPFTMIDDEIVYSANTAKITVTKGSENSYEHVIVSTDTVPAVPETVVE